MPNLPQASPVHLHNIPSFLSTATVNIWQVAGFPTDFPSRLDGLVIDYILEKWDTDQPPVKGTSPKTQSRDINIGNFDYDNFRTYYIKVTELPARIVTRERDNLIEFNTPIEFEVNVRRLAKGEAFREMQSIILELIRIFVMFQQYDIYGIGEVDFESLTPMSRPEHRTRHTAIKTIWKKALRINLHYHKVSLLRPA